MTERVVVITTDNEVSVRDLELKNDSMYEGLKEIVGGYIEIVHPMNLRGLEMIVNEEGVLLDLPVNIIASILYGALVHGNFIFGDVAICDHGYRNGEPDLEGLSHETASQVVDYLSQICVI